MAKPKFQKDWWKHPSPVERNWTESHDLPKGVYGDIPAELFGAPFSIFKTEYRVYVIIKDGTVLYVGRSSSLKSRIDSHRNEKGGQFSVVFFETKSDSNTESMETALIHLLKPQENRAKNGELGFHDIATLLSNGVFNFEHELKNEVLSQFAKRADKIGGDT